ncbi:MAG: M36 family metallopeptidase [Pyrinomonadaceae bacterium]|nr:M36 family metallopeptidase [Pyrinomonadaceae bacterium]MCX7640080.1 M36 family metallopeptidase [Pyrinomonadaceae bacterium]MDW8304252.1 M36 family metallopeptidase [Acidobacteriota bacterium]
MWKKLDETRKGLLISLFAVGLLVGIMFVPQLFQSEASEKNGKPKKGLFQRTESHEEGLENYDIREDKSEAAQEALLKFREKSGKDAAAIADIREGFVRGEENLRRRVPSLKVEYNSDIRIPEVITPDVWKAEIERLTEPSQMKRSEILRNFVKQNNELFGVSDSQADALVVLSDYENPAGNMGFAHLEQRINGVPVFRGEVKAGFTKNGEIIRVVNNLAPGLDYQSLSTDFRNPVDAVIAAARYANYELKEGDTTPNAAASDDLKVKFGRGGDWDITAEKMYFPTEPGVAVPAWRVLIWKPVNAYYVIVDAETGTMLWRKNITEDQTQPATYNVYANPNAFIPVHDSPAPFTPGPTDPTTGAQAPVINRVNQTRVGNEPPYTFNNNGWINDGQNVTDGNAVEAGIDRDGVNGVDAPQTGSPNRVFTTSSPAWNPPPGNPAPGDDPLTPQAQRGAVIQMFWVMNWYHDELYRLGFTEPAFNFQHDNFGRGGLGNDRVSAEGQDSSGTNNANFATPADGGRGRMQMYIWTGPTPDYDGTTDADVIIHEVTHGLSNRLHGNASGLTSNMSRGMGEGWSDWYAHVMLSEPTDPINGIYTTGGYVTYLVVSGFTANYYYGIRRFPKAVISFTGGPSRPACGNAPCPHNPLTFRHLNSNCNTEIGTTTSANISAFPRGPIGSSTCDQVHNAGEIWSSALWEVRSLMVQRLGWANGTRCVLQVVTDGMKLSPLNPTFLQGRDSIIQAATSLPAACGTSSANVSDIREGFRRRGMGFSASIQSTSPAQVTEAFDYPNVQYTDPLVVSDSPGDNDGYPEPGENLLISVSVRNNTGATINNVFANINGGPNVSYGNIADGQTVTRQIPYTVPASAPCGSMHQIQINVSSDVGTQAPVTREFRLGVPVGGPPVTFSNTQTLTIPDNGPTTPYGTTINVSGLTGNKKIKFEVTGITHTFPADLDFLLVGPGGQKYIFLSDSGGSGDVVNLTFTLSDSATQQPSTTQWTAGEFLPYNSGANDPFPTPAPSGPYSNAAPAGTDTFTSTFGMNGANLNGTWTLYVVDDAAGDSGTMAGWKLTFESDDYTCSLSPSVRSRADFDGDGRTDISVYRQSNNTWYLQRSTAGFTSVLWGSGSDIPVPGDYDGDGKADIAVYRGNNAPGLYDYFVLRSSTNTLMSVEWGLSGDIPVTGDYDGDGKFDYALYRPSDNYWYILKGSDFTILSMTQFGQSGDVPLTGDFDGDGKSDRAVYRGGTWIIQRSSGGQVSISWGLPTDAPVPADYDGDNKDDVAVFRNGTWYIMRSTDNSMQVVNFGASGDVPVPGDYDGDGKDDVAVYRNGTWYVNRSTSGFLAAVFGLGTDTALPKRYIP